jgi:uncharacterized protein (DUF924 family)
MQSQSILHFWFAVLTPKQHFAKDAALNEAIRTRFGTTLEAAALCELFAWRFTPEGAAGGGIGAGYQVNFTKQ